MAGQDAPSTVLPALVGRPRHQVYYTFVHLHLSSFNTFSSLLRVSWWAWLRKTRTLETRLNQREAFLHWRARLDVILDVQLRVRVVEL